jgi:uncharacterized membrane protein
MQYLKYITIAFAAAFIVRAIITGNAGVNERTLYRNREPLKFWLALGVVFFLLSLIIAQQLGLVSDWPSTD